MVLKARTGPGQSQQPGSSTRPPPWIKGTQILGPFFTAFPRPLTKSWIGHGPAPVWDCQHWQVIALLASHNASLLKAPSKERFLGNSWKLYISEITLIHTWLLTWAATRVQVGSNFPKHFINTLFYCLLVSCTAIGESDAILILGPSYETLFSPLSVACKMAVAKFLHTLSRGTFVWSIMLDSAVTERWKLTPYSSEITEWFCWSVPLFFTYIQEWLFNILIFSYFFFFSLCLLSIHSRTFLTWFTYHSYFIFAIISSSKRVLSGSLSVPFTKFVFLFIWKDGEGRERIREIFHIPSASSLCPNYLQ